MTIVTAPDTLAASGAMLPNHYRTSASTIGEFHYDPILKDLAQKMTQTLVPVDTMQAPTMMMGGYPRANTLLPSPPGAKYKLCVVQFKVWRRCARILVSIATECALLSRRFFAILVITGAWGQERRL